MVTKQSGKSIAAAPASAETAELDEFHGKGGSYVIENGVRRLVERTKSREEAEAEAAAEAPVDETPPASTGDSASAA